MKKCDILRITAPKNNKPSSKWNNGQSKRKSLSEIDRNWWWKKMSRWYKKLKSPSRICCICCCCGCWCWWCCCNYNGDWVRGDVTFYRKTTITLQNKKSENITDNRNKNSGISLKRTSFGAKFCHNELFALDCINPFKFSSHLSYIRSSRKIRRVKL